MRNKIKFFIILILIIFLITCFYIDNNVFKLTLYNEESIDGSLLDGKVIIHISDLHNKEYGKNNIDLINKIDEINPDYIFMTGDMVNAEDTNFNGFYSLIEHIGKLYKCYYVVGNHELGLTKSDFNELIDHLKEYNITYLNNESEQISDNVIVYGLNYSSKYYLKEKYEKENMDKDLGESDKNAFNIVLAHNPNDFDTYSEWGADLVFSGHTHGGMIRILDKGIISPSRAFFPQYDGGVFEKNNSLMINSKGLSRGHIGFRLFNQPELVIIEF